MSRPVNPILTPWETKLMQIIWDHGKATAAQIQQALHQQGFHRSNSAIRKTLRVMETKGYLKHAVQDRTYCYYSLYQKSKAEQEVIHYLRDVFFNGSAAEMMLRIMDEADLTPDIVKEMKKKLRKEK